MRGFTKSLTLVGIVALVGLASQPADAYWWGYPYPVAGTYRLVPVVPAQPVLTVRQIALRPVVLRPATVQPVAVRPVTLRPVAIKPVTLRPVAVKPLTIQPLTLRPLVAGTE